MTPVSREISVVVQGPVVGAPSDPPSARLTLRCLESVRRYLPGAEVVLSTWRGTDVGGLDFDRLVESDDPGGMRCDDWPQSRAAAPMPYNANRQIVSVREGLRAATRPYAAKVRSDLLLTGAGFLGYFGRFPARNPAWRLLRDRVVIPDWWSGNPRVPGGTAFNPSDWFQFGRRDDLLDLWDVPLADAEMAMWFARRPRPAAYARTHVHFRYTVEQYTWLAFLRRHGDVPFAHMYDVTPESTRLSELALVNNFVVADMRALDLRFVKYGNSLVHWATLYTHGEWQELYREYCDPAFVPARDPRRRWKDLYRAHVAPVHGAFADPRSVAWTRAVSMSWEARSPRSFRAARDAYVRALGALRRAPWRRA